MNDRIQRDLKRISSEMQLAKNPDNIVVMEAMDEIQDLQAKYDQISKQYVDLLKEYRELAQRLIDTGNTKLIKPDWDDPNWQVGYITGVTDMIAVVKEEIENEIH